MRGKALVDAEEWGKEKNLSYQDKQFLAASREKEIQEKIAADEREAQLERERKDKEAVEKRNLVLSEANKKAKQRIRNGTVVLSLALAFTAISSFVAANRVREASKTNEYLETVEKLAKLAGELEDESSDSEAKELLSQAGQSVNIKDHKLRLAILNAGISYAYQKLKSQDLEKAQEYLDKSKQLSGQKCKSPEENISNEASQFCVLALKTEANLLKEENKPKEAIKKYQLAYKFVEKLKSQGERGKNTGRKISPPFQNLQIKILSKQNIEALHREFIDLLSKSGNKNKENQVKESLKEHYLDELDNLLGNKKWKEADQRTYRLMLYVVNRESDGFLDIDSLKTFSCKTLQDIDSLWVQNSDERFGFSVQKKIWAETGNQLGIIEPSDEDAKNRKLFISRVGWYDSERNKVKSYSEVIELVEKDYQQASYGTLPDYRGVGTKVNVLFSRCNL